MTRIMGVVYLATALLFGAHPTKATDLTEKVWITFDATATTKVTKELNDWDVHYQLDATGAGDLVSVALVNKGDLSRLTNFFHDNLNRCGGYMVHTSAADARAMNARLAQLNRRNALAKMPTYTLDNAEVVNILTGTVSEDDIVDVIAALSSFENRFYDSTHGVNAAHWLRDHWLELTEGRDDASAELFSHNGFPQPSVILTLQGSEFPDEVVVLGGHLDSTLRSGSFGASPGADDDASGIACLTEVIRVIANSEFRPKRTVKFMGYAGEEHGLLGSRDIADTYAGQGVNVVGAMQLDMTNYHGSADDIWIMTDYTDTAQNTFMAQLIDTYLTDLTRNTSSCGYPCSDHASWFQAGYPVSMTAETRFGEHNPNLHTSNDTLAVSGGGAVHAEKFARLAAAFVAELAKGDMATPASPLKQTMVNILTISGQMAALGPCENPSECYRDLDGNGVVDSVDVGLLYGDWFQTTCLGFVEGDSCPE